MIFLSSIKNCIYEGLCDYKYVILNIHVNYINMYISIMLYININIYNTHIHKVIFNNVKNTSI